jgi:PEP-CTERM motif-containing protein
VAHFDQRAPGRPSTGRADRGYLTFSGNLTAASFDNYDFTTRTSGSLNPNFDGDPILFDGLTQESGIGAPSENLITQYDNLTFAINVPEPFTLSLFGVGLAGAAAMRRCKAKA